jgi:hypothetical protein
VFQCTVPRRIDNELVEILDAWKGSRVVVRIVTREDELVAVFRGCLQARSHEKHPALYWPVESADAPEAERPGIYLHPGSYEGARIHEGNFVVEYVQASVTVNVRRLDDGRF